MVGKTISHYKVLEKMSHGEDPCKQQCVEDRFSKLQLACRWSYPIKNVKLRRFSLQSSFTEEG